MIARKKKPIDIRTIEALKTQIESSTRAGITDSAYYGLNIATFAIIQAHKLTLEEAQKVVDKVGIYITRKNLEMWIKQYK